MSLLSKFGASLSFRLRKIADGIFYNMLARGVPEKLIFVDEKYVEAQGGTITFFGEPESKTLQPPIYQPPYGSAKIEREIGDVQWPKRYVALLNGIAIANSRNPERTANPMARTQDGHILEQASHDQHFLRRELTMRFRIDEIARIATNHPWRIRKRARQIDLATSLAYEPHRNFYHWMIDALPRLEAVNVWEEQTGEKPLFLLGEQVNERQVRSLELLGFSQDRFVHLGKEGAFIERLVLPSFCNGGFLPMPAAMKWLRKRMLADFPVEASQSSASPYLYVTRRRASRRRVLNEDEVLRIMEPLGFQVVEAENIPTLDEEIALFRGTRVIAGPLGAGLVNMIFAESPVVFELMPPEAYLNHAYYGLAASLGFPYAYLSATESVVEDFIVDLELLQKALDVVMRAANP